MHLTAYDASLLFSVGGPVGSDNNNPIEEIVREEKVEEQCCSHNPFIDAFAFPSLIDRINCKNPCKSVIKINNIYCESLKPYEQKLSEANAKDAFYYQATRWGKITTGAFWGFGIGLSTGAFFANYIQLAWRTTFVFSSASVGGAVGAGCGEVAALFDNPNRQKVLTEIYNQEISKFGLMSNKIQQRLGEINQILSQIDDKNNHAELRLEAKQLTDLCRYCVRVLEKSSEQGFQNSLNEFLKSFSLKV